MKSFLMVVRGFLIGTAEAIPGISGGTVALIVGIYKFLIENVLEPFIQMVVAGDIKWCYGHRFKCTVLVVTF